MSSGKPYHFKFFKGCLQQILLGPFLKTLCHINIWRHWGHSKSAFAWKFQFLTTLLLFVPVRFTCTPPPSTYIRFSEFTRYQKKFRDCYEFSNEKSGNEKRKQNYFFCKINIKDQFFLHSYIYNNNKSINLFIKKNLYPFLIKKHLYIMD